MPMLLPPICTAFTLMNNLKAKPKALIEGVLHVTTKEMLGGGSKSNKTWAQLDKAVSVASGTPWLGMVTQKSKVLFMNMELLEPFFMERLQLVLEAKKIKVEDCNLDIWHLRGHSEGYNVFLQKIEEVMKNSAYELVIMDPLYKLYGTADENKATDIIAMMNRFEQFVQVSQCALSYSSHFAKGQQHEKYAIDRVSGSGAFARDADTISTLTKHKEKGCFTVDFILRHCPEIEPFVVQWEAPLMVRRVDLDPKDLHQQSKSTANGANDHAELVQLLGENGLAAKEWCHLAGEQHGVKERTFYNRVKRLSTKGLIVNEEGKWRTVRPTY